MKQENYKAIAEIIKKRMDIISGYRNITPKTIKIILKVMVKDFADYFEKEDKKFTRLYNKLNDGIRINQFSRKQFLEWCGVK